MSESDLKIRLASPGEVALVHDLTQASFAETSGYANPSTALEESLDSVRKEMRFDFAAIAWLGDEPVASVRFEVERANRPFEPGEPPGGTLTFRRMGVVPGSRDKGVGKALVAWLDQFAIQMGLDELVTCVRSQQPDNRPFYQALGFSITGYSGRFGIADLRTHMRRSLVR